MLCIMRNNNTLLRIMNGIAWQNNRVFKTLYILSFKNSVIFEARRPTYWSICISAYIQTQIQIVGNTFMFAIGLLGFLNPNKPGVIDNEDRILFN